MMRSLLLACVLSGTTAAAESPVLAGTWSFKAWVDSDCDFTGVASLGTPDASGSPGSCELTARQACTSGLAWTVRQSCTAKLSGNRLVVRSAIEEFLEGSPTDSYWPDNFLLTVESSERMFGALHSYGAHKAVWERDEGAVS